MPVVFRWKGFRFHFFSDEGDPREPIHIHVTKAGHNAKFWLYPVATLPTIAASMAAPCPTSKS